MDESGECWLRAGNWEPSPYRLQRLTPFLALVIIKQPSVSFFTLAKTNLSLYRLFYDYTSNRRVVRPRARHADDGGHVVAVLGGHGQEGAIQGVPARERLLHASLQLPII